MAEIEVDEITVPVLDGRVDTTDSEETTRDVTEKEEVLDDGTVQKTHCTVTKLFRSRAAADEIAGEQKWNYKDRVLVSIDIDERIMLIPPNVGDINGLNITSDEHVEYHEEVMDGVVPCRKKTTTITFCALITTTKEDSVVPLTDKDISVIPCDVAVTQREVDVVESFDAEVLSPKPAVVSRDDSSSVTDVAHPSDSNNENVQVVGDIQHVPEVSVPSTTVRVSQRVRRIGSDGEIVEAFETGDSLSFDATSDHTARLDDDAALSDVVYCHFLSAADTEDLPEHELPADSAVQVYAKTVEEEPVVERTVEEFEDVLEDGTVVRRRVTKTTQKKTVVQQVLVEGGKGAADDDVTATAPAVMEYTDVSFGGPEEVQSNVEESEEVLSDGTVVRRKVMTTSHQQLITERHILAGEDSNSRQLPSVGDSDVVLAPVNGKQSPQSYIPELMKLSGTESDSTKEQGELFLSFLVFSSAADPAFWCRCSEKIGGKPVCEARSDLLEK